MKGKTFRRSLSAALVMAMVLGNVSGVTARAETGEGAGETTGEAKVTTQEITLANSDMSFDIPEKEITELNRMVVSIHLLRRHSTTVLRKR